MRIVAHRGLPESIDGKGGNTLADYERAFKAGLDVEMDVRFHGRDVYCSHDPLWPDSITDGLYPLFMEFCALLKQYPQVTAFVNVKCDGMTGTVREIAVAHGVLDRIVTFDHSMPDFLFAEKQFPDVQRCVRASAYEWAIGVRQKPNRWVWLDPIGLVHEKMVRLLITKAKAFHTINETSRVVVVSPDVHCKTAEEFDKVNMPGFAWEIARLPIYGVLTDRPTMFGCKP